MAQLAFPGWAMTKNCSTGNHCVAWGVGALRFLTDYAIKNIQWQQPFLNIAGSNKHDPPLHCVRDFPYMMTVVSPTKKA